MLTQAQESTEKTKKAKLQELHDLTASSAAMNLEGYTYTDRTGKSVYIPSGFEVSQVSREVGEMKNGKLLVENEVDEGLVVIDKYGDEFVWITVEADGSNFTRKISSNWRIKSGVDNGTDSNGGNSEIASLRDNFGNNKLLAGSTSGGESTDVELNTVKKAKGFFVSRYEIGADGSSQRELKRPSGNTQDVGTFDINYYENSADTSADKYWKYARETDTTAGNTEKRQAIIDRILPKLNSKQGIEPIRMMTQDECLWLANEWKSGKDYQSGLMTGRTWDRMVSWICDDESDATKFTVALAKTDSSSWGNYGCNTKSTTYKSIFTSGDGNCKWIAQGPNFSRDKIDGTQKYVFPTGEFITDIGRDTKMKNVYDVAGNVWEWTTEESHYSGTEPNWNNRVLRGGSAGSYGSDAPASRRTGNCSGTTDAISNIGFRCVLYVKPM